jgi:hypothetical protein
VDTADAEGAEDELDPRARIFDANTGEVRFLKRSQVEGLDSFVGNWQQNVELPHEMSFGGWQMADEAHPVGTGKPSYRLVHKTIRTLFFPQMKMEFPNLLIKFYNGEITLGEPRFEGALPGRSAGNYLVPEWGELKVDGEDVRYVWEPNVNIRIEAHQETTPATNYVELLYHLPEGDWQGYAEMVAAGRSGIAPLTAMLDFLYGERILGPVLTEEVGEVFDDWHWNRLLGGRTVSMESQARFEIVDGQALASRLTEAIDRQLTLDTSARIRLRIACQWYWRADI